MVGKGSVPREGSRLEMKVFEMVGVGLTLKKSVFPSKICPIDCANISDRIGNLVMMVGAGKPSEGIWEEES